LCTTWSSNGIRRAPCALPQSKHVYRPLAGLC
jgi:hypothetical protein